MLYFTYSLLIIYLMLFRFITNTVTELKILLIPHVT